jgi:hypothetical protein
MIMEIFKYNTEIELIDKAIELGYEAFNSGVSISFRIYNSVGNTKEFHVFYY